MTGAVAAALSVGEPAHHPLDRMGFYSFGQHLKPAVCEKCHNPKNSKKTCTDATTADDCEVMSLGHSRLAGRGDGAAASRISAEILHVRRLACQASGGLGAVEYGARQYRYDVAAFHAGYHHGVGARPELV